VIINNPKKVIILGIFVLNYIMLDNIFATIQERENEMYYIINYKNQIEAIKNNSTSPAAVKLQLKSSENGRVINCIVRSDDLSFFIVSKAKLFNNLDDYIKYMNSDDNGSKLYINLDDLKKYLGERWGGKQLLLQRILLSKTLLDKKYLLAGENYFNQYVAYDSPITFEKLEVRSEKELLDKYFNYDYNKCIGTIKEKYYNAYNRNPSFIALIMDLGYSAGWYDIAPILHIGKSCKTIGGDF